MVGMEALSCLLTIVVVLGLVECLSTTLLVFAEAKSNRTNIVVLLCDDLGYGDVEYQSTDPLKGPRTPNINEMAFASSTLRFSNFHATATTCSPTRSSLLSGRTPYRECVAGANVQNVRFFQKYRDMYPFRPDMGSVARSAKAAGYATAFFGKWHIGPIPQRSPGTMGFDKWIATLTNIPTYDPYCFVPELQCMKSCRWTPFRCVRLPRSKWCGSQITFSTCYYGRHPGNQLFTSGYDPRMLEPRPTESPSSPKAKTQIVDIPRRTMMADALISKFETFARNVPVDQPIFAYVWFYEPHQPFIGSPELNALCLNGTTCKGSYSTTKITEEIDYFSVVVAIDRALGRVRKILRDIGRADDTILVFTSDNGPAEGTFASPGRFVGFKLGMDEASHRVPGLIEWPARIKSNTQIDELASTVDLYSTFRDLFMMETRTSSPSLAPQSTIATETPSHNPTSAVTHTPSRSPTSTTTTHTPTHSPTIVTETHAPSGSPTLIVTHNPSRSPTTTGTHSPSHSPTSAAPSVSPSSTATNTPSNSPTPATTLAPSASPTLVPTHLPSNSPTLLTHVPSHMPSGSPTSAVTLAPSNSPTPDASDSPSSSPTSSSTDTPSSSPASTFSDSPSSSPSSSPTSSSTDSPSSSPTSTFRDSLSSSPTFFVASLSQKTSSSFRDIADITSRGPEVPSAEMKASSTSPDPGAILQPVDNNIASLVLPQERPTDGVSLLPLLINPNPREWIRERGLGFCLPKYLPTETACALFDYRWKNWSLLGPWQRNALLYSNSTLSLYDIENDPTQTNNLAKTRPDIFGPLMKVAVDWVTSVTTEYFKNCPGAK